MKTDFNILFRCPYCKVRLEAKDAIAGKTVKCANCLKVIKVPKESQASSGVRQESK
jgi:hypothetical protein